MSEHITETENVDPSDLESPPSAWEQIRESVEDMHRNILELNQRSNLISSGLTDNTPPEPEEDTTDYSSPEVQRKLIEDGSRMLSEAGYYDQVNAPSTTELELRANALETTLDAYGSDEAFDAGLELAQLSPQFFLSTMQARHQAEVEENIEAYGFEEGILPDDLDPETLREIQDTDASKFATEVIAEATADAQETQQQGLQRQAEKQNLEDQAQWANTVLEGFGANHLSDDQAEQLMWEIGAVQQWVTENGYEGLERLVDGFEPDSMKGQVVADYLSRPISSYAPNDPELPRACRVLRTFGKAFLDSGMSNREQRRMQQNLKIGGLTDRERRAYLEEFDHEYRSKKKIISMDALNEAVKKDPLPARTGKQLQKDLQTGARMGGPTSAQIRAELDRAAKNTEKHNAKQEARRRGLAR
jgi:hypothetical protein